MGWLVHRHGQTVGPFDDAVVIGWIRQGMRDAKICAAPGGPWLDLAGYPPFAAALGASPKRGGCLSHAIGALLLLVPFATGIGVLVFGRSIGPALSLVIGGAAVALSAALVAVDRIALRMRVAWMTLVTFVAWIVGYPLHLYSRKAGGGWNLIVPGLLVAVVFVGGTILGSDVAAFTRAALVHPAFRDFGPLAEPTDVRASAQLDAPGGSVVVNDGAELVVPGGALGRSVPLEVRRVRMRLDEIDFTVGSSWAYVVGSSEDVAKLGAPVVLRVPNPPAHMQVLRYEDGSWKTVPVGAGADTRVEIPHFSWWPFMMIEESAASSAGTDPDDVRRSQFIRDLVGKPDTSAAVKQFYGVGEAYSGPRDDLCGSLRRAISTTQGADFGFPPDASWRNWQLGTFLHDGNAPSTSSGYFWNLTSDKMDAIKAEVLSDKHPAGSLMPGDMLRICVDACGGNVPLGVLACHNFLKDVTYRGRNPPHGLTNEIPKDYGVIASKLVTWRSTDVSPAGAYDKMGPLYHVFAAMTAAVWFNGAGIGGYAARYGEEFLRVVRHGGDRPDPEKGEADACGADVGRFVRSLGIGNDLGIPGLLPAAPPRSIDDGSDAAAGDAALALLLDGGARASDGGADWDEDAGGFAYPDASPDPGPSSVDWPGRWRGPAKSTIVIDGKAQPEIDGTLVLIVTRTGPTTLHVAAPGANEPVDLEISPSNPNVASTQKSKSVGNAVDNATAQAHYVAFLRQGRMYLTIRTDSVGHGQLGGYAATSDVHMDTISILDPEK